MSPSAIFVAFRSLCHFELPICFYDIFSGPRFGDPSEGGPSSPSGKKRNVCDVVLLGRASLKQTEIRRIVYVEPNPILDNLRIDVNV